MKSTIEHQEINLMMHTPVAAKNSLKTDIRHTPPIEEVDQEHDQEVKSL